MLLSDVSIRSMLSDAALAGEPVIEPAVQDRNIQPATVDLQLGMVDRPCNGKNWPDGKPAWWRLKPGMFTLGSTVETICMPDRLAGWVAGKSSWARRGLIVEAAGFVDPGFRGQITLELFNMSGDEITLTLGEPICQIAFMQMDRPAARPYGTRGLGSRYQHQTGPTEARPLRTA